MEYSDTREEIKIILWPNGKSSDHCFTIKIDQSIDTLRRFKEILFYQRNLNKSYFDKIKFYNTKGIEIDDSDISYLTNKQIIYISYEGSKFSNSNYFNEYTFIKSIKKGGYAEVYLAKHCINKNLVAIKKTDLHHFSPDHLFNISREAVYLSTLIHKNIIKIHSSFTYEGYLYNVMDYAEGGELTQLLTDPSPISEQKIKEIYMQIIKAVRFVHNKNVIHRDLKLNNILFLDKEKTQIVIIDFGISGTCNGMSREVIKAGTLKYTPPELLTTETYQSSPKIDIWALGVILYLMNFKEFPFEGNSKEVIEKIINQQVKFPKGINVKIKKSLVKLIEGMLCKNPNKRIGLDSPLIEEWFNDESNEYAVFIEKKEPVNNRKFDRAVKSKSPNKRNNMLAHGNEKSKSPIKRNSVILKANDKSNSLIKRSYMVMHGNMKRNEKNPGNTKNTGIYHRSGTLNIPKNSINSTKKK